LCEIDVTLTCQSSSEGISGIDCSDISSEVDLICECEEGIGALTFIYSGPADQSITCQYIDANALTREEEVFENLSTGDSIIINDIADNIVSISCALDGSGESFSIDPTCELGNPRDLILKQTFGPSSNDDLLTFAGYICDVGNGAPSDEEPETHFCLIDVEYFIKICNIGAGLETITTIDLTVEKDGESTPVETDDSFIGVVLQPSIPDDDSNCVTVSGKDRVDLCTEAGYDVTANVEVASPTRKICDGEDTLDFTTSENTLSPTKSPTVTPTASPTTSPTSSPTRSPTVSPTSSPTSSPTRDDTTTLNPTSEPSKIPCTEDCECSSLYTGTTGRCICEYEDPTDPTCEFDNGGIDNGDNGGSGGGGGSGDDNASTDRSKDGKNKKKSKDGKGKKSKSRRNRRLSGDDDDDGSSGSGGGGGNDAGQGDPIFTANCCDCECTEIPCTCECLGYVDPVDATDINSPQSSTDGKGKGGKDKNSKSRRDRRTRRLQTNDGEEITDSANHTHESSRHASGLRKTSVNGPNEGNYKKVVASDSPATSWHSWIVQSLWTDDESTMPQSAADVDVEDVTNKEEPRELAFTTTRSSLIFALTGDDDDDGSDNGGNDGGNDGGDQDDCTRPAYRCYYRKFFPPAEGCRQPNRKCKANTIGHCEIQTPTRGS
jgi:hypothetical protein